MAHTSHRLLAVISFFTLFAGTALGAKFTQREFKITAPANAPVSLELRSLVKEVAAGQTLRFVPHNLPSWLAYDATNLRLTGTPAATGTFRFGLEVYQGGTNDFAFVEYGVYSPPKWTKATIDLGTQYENRPWSVDLNSFLQQRPVVQLTFSATGLPRWMKLEGDKLTGTPAAGDAGNYAGITLRVQGPVGTPAVAQAAGRVAKMPTLPKWKKDAITLDEALEDRLFEQVLAEHVSNPDNVPMTFSLVAGQHPAWINLTNAGKLFGIPRRKDVGPATVQVKLKASVAGQSVDDDVRFQFQVVRVNKAPYWTEDPVLLPKGLQDNPYLADLSPFVNDPDLDLGDGLFLDIVSGPSWATIAPPAYLKGEPPAGLLGTQSWRIKVTDASGLSATATVITELVKANKPPVFQPGVEFTVKVRQTLVKDLNDFVTEPEGETVSFEPVQFPAWASLGADGRLELAPKYAHVGEHNLGIRVGDGNTKVMATFRVVVLEDPKPPVWLEDPIRIEAISGVPFAVSVADRAHDLDGRPLTFKKVSGPDWLAVDAAGRVGGSPKDADVGETTFGIAAANASGETPARLVVKVRQGNRPPKWATDPIQLGHAKEGVQFQFDLDRHASDPDGDTLRYSKVIGPAWMRVSATGKVWGTPFSADAGEFAAVFEATDGKLSVQVGAKGRVGSGNLPPEIKSGALSFRIQEKATTIVELKDKKYVEDPEGDPLEFKLLSALAWVTLSPEGALTLKPTSDHLGKHQVRFEVSDGANKASGTAQVEVVRDPRPPIWVEDPIQSLALVGQPYSLNVAEKVHDPAGLPVTITKVSGPGWLNVTGGSVSGTPTAADVGTNTFVLRASNGELTADGRLVIDVRNQADTLKIALTDPVVDAPLDVLWVIDHSIHTQQLMGELNQAVRSFYATLDQAQVRHTSAVLSTRHWDGKFFTGPKGESFFTSDDPSAVDEFRSRVQKALAPSTALNSPIWAVSRLHHAVQTTGEMPKGFFREGAPLEVFVLTVEGDYYPQLAKGSPQATYAVSDFTRVFRDFHGRAAQPLSFTFYDMRCPAAYNPNNPSVRPAYLQLAMDTLGTYFFQAPQCDVRISGAVGSFARSAFTRAHVFAKRRFLVPKGVAASQLKLTLMKQGASIPLGGNTGASDDKWVHDAKSGEITLRWDRIDTRVGTGDELHIKY